jgi:hypothetical protein
MNLADFKALVERHGPVVRDGGDWRGRCPCHDDDGRRGDLTFRQGDDGRIVLHCWGGCSAKSVVSALGLQWSDLFSENGHGRPQATVKPQKVYRTLYEAVEAIQQRLGGSYTSDWTYHDASVDEVLTVLRFDACKALDGKKTYRPVHPVPGGFAEGDPAGPLPLYGLPKLLADTSSPVFIVEGEKCCSAGRKIGLLCTTSAHGAGGEGKTDWTPLAGRDCVILPDRDDAGEGYAERVASILMGLSPAARVKIVRLPGLSTKGDLTDYIDDSEAEDPETIRQQIMGLSAQAELVTQSKKVLETEAVSPTREKAPAEQMCPEYVCMADVEAKPVRWLWQDRLPGAMLSLLIGVEGRGKTFVALDMAARITTGRFWPDAQAPEDVPLVGNVVFLTSEDHLEYTVRPRLDAMGADASRVFALRGVKSEKGSEFFDVVKHLPALEEMVKSIGNVRLIICDPLTAFLGATDQHKNGEVRTALARFSGLAERYGCAVLGISHLSKDASKAAIHRIIGSVAFSAAARAVWLVADDKDGDTRRIFCPVKCNLAPLAKSLAFRIEDGAVHWEAGQFEANANDLLSDGNGESPLNEAVQFLREILADGRVLSKEVQKLAKQSGISERTLNRAKKVVGVKSEREGIGVTSVWFWRLSQ